MANSSCVFAYSNLTEEVAAARAEQVGDVSYQLSVNLDKGAQTFTGTNILKFDLTNTKADVVLDFDGKQVNEVVINGKKTDAFVFDSEDENIVLPKKLLSKGENTVSVAFEAYFKHDGAGLHQYKDPKDGNEYYYTDLQAADAHRVFPHFDQPSIKATFTLDVNAPVDWQVVSNMPEIRTTQAGQRKHSYFDTTKKMPSYIMHLSAGPYAMWQDNTGKYPMRVFTRQSLAQYMDAKVIFDATKKGFELFEAYYDYEYPFTKYDHLFVPEFNAGAMENAGAVTMSERYISRSKPTANRLAGMKVTIMHELAHMWFGDLVTMTWWNDLWLNESFADMMGYVGLAGLGDEQAWQRAARRKNWAYYEDQLMTTHPILSDIPDILSASANFDGITYAKGLAALRQLEYYIGKETFRDGIRLYFKKHAFGNTTLDDFIAALEAAHGSDLDAWVTQWLATMDVNSMQLSYEVKNGKMSAAKVSQTGGRHDATLRTHANLVGLYYVENGKLTLKDKVKIIFDGESTKLPAFNGRKVPDLIIPNLEDYDYVKVRFDERSMAWLKDNMSMVTDPAIKSVVWRTLWDMVRDREFKTKDFYALAIKQIEKEQDVSMVNTLVSNLGSIVNRYTANVQDRNIKRAYVFKMAQKRLTEIEAGSDLQRAWFDILVGSASNPTHYRHLAELFDGKASVDGIEMNNDRQWDILRQLAEANQRNMVKDRLEKLVAKDTSARGKNYALLIESSYPTMAVKEKIWQSLTEQSDYSLLQKRYIGSGMYNGDHPQLARPFIDRYFKQIEAIHENGDSFTEAKYFIQAMFPTHGMEKTVVAAEQFLATSEVPKTYKNMVMKSLDELNRTLAVRKTNL